MAYSNFLMNNNVKSTTNKRPVITFKAGSRVVSFLNDPVQLMSDSVFPDGNIS